MLPFLVKSFYWAVQLGSFTFALVDASFSRILCSDRRIMCNFMCNDLWLSDYIRLWPYDYLENANNNTKIALLEKEQSHGFSEFSHSKLKVLRKKTSTQ